MLFGTEHEIATIRTARNRPTRQSARHFGHIVLRVPTVHAECVQLHQFASVILVQSTTTIRAARHELRQPLLGLRQCQLAYFSESLRGELLYPCSLRRWQQASIHQFPNRRIRRCGTSDRPLTSIGSGAAACHRATLGGESTRRRQRRTPAVGHALPVVEVVEHRGTFGDGAQKIAELAHRLRADRIRVVLRQEVARAVLSGKNVEMIFPEVDHYLLQLTLGHHRPSHSAGRDFAEKRV